MSLNKQTDVKDHLSHRTRSQIHLIPPVSQPDATGDSGEELAQAELATGDPVEGTLKQSSAGDSDSSHSGPSAVSKSVQE